MKRVTIKLLAVVLWSAAFSWFAGPSAYAQPGSFGDLGKIPSLGEIRGLTTFSESHLAVWYSNVRKDQAQVMRRSLLSTRCGIGNPRKCFGLTVAPRMLGND